MIRGFLISERLLAEKRITRNLPLLIVGAGAAGATAAVVAASHGVSTTLVDKEEQPFSRQLYCPTRFLSPTDYDWPSAQWHVGRFPFKGIMFPFSWSAKYAALAAASWRAKLFRQARTTPNLRLLLSWRVRSPNLLLSTSRDSNLLVNVEFEDNEGNRESYRTAVVVACTGPGKERCSVSPGGYTGRAFWEPDNLQESGFGLGSLTRPRILLSGGGDGVLQDFLRVTTKCSSAGEILATLPEWAQLRLAASVRDAEDQFRSAYLHNTTKYDCRASHILHQAYSAAVIHLLDTSSPAEYDELDSLLTGILRAVHREFMVKLVHPCSHFTHCYPLNRILVLLIAEFAKRKYHLALVSGYTRVLQVTGHDHNECGRDKASCRSGTHSVKLALARCADIYEPTGGIVERQDDEPYNLIILRHGIKPEYFFGKPPIGNPRQVLPNFVDLDWY